MKFILLMLLALPTLSFANQPKSIILTKKNTISFNDEFNPMTVANKQKELFELAESSPEKELYIVMYSPGGSVSAGSLFIDTVKALGKKVHTITIFSASMGYQTVQGLGNRYILPSGTLMSHRAYIEGLSGQFPGELNTRINMLMSSTERLDQVAANRVGISLEEYKKQVHDELWLVGQQAVDLGHADAVVNAVCDESLSGTHKEIIGTMFGPVELEYSNCPLITGFLGYEFKEYVNEKAAFEFT